MKQTAINLLQLGTVFINCKLYYIVKVNDREETVPEVLNWFRVMLHGVWSGSCVYFFQFQAIDSMIFISGVYTLT